MTVLLCPGQGAQYVGMGRDVADAWPVARAVFERADEALGMDLSSLLFEGPEEQVHRTDVCQPGILTVTVAIWEVLRTEGVVDPGALRFAAGLSLGEYTAHYVAGTIGFEDAVRLVRRRGELMQAASDAVPSGMAAVMGLEPEAVEGVCAGIRDDGGICVVANLNCPGQVVVSGEQGALERCGEVLTERGARRFVPLTVAGAFHSPVMQSAADGLADVLDGVEFGEPRIPVVSNVTAAPVTTAAEARATLSRQVVAPVLFERSLRFLVDQGVARLVEPGPGRTLSGFLRKIDRRQPVENYDGADHVRAALTHGGEDA